MFSRGGAVSQSSGRKIGLDETSMDELVHCIDRLEILIRKTRTGLQAKRGQERKSKPGALIWRRGASNGEDTKLKEKQTQPAQTRSSQREPSVETASFVPMDSYDQDEMVETLRRIAELVVMGERGAAAAQAKRDKRKESIPNGEEEDTASESDYIALFEQFFERNALSLIVTLLTGAAFSNQIGQSKDVTKDMDGCALLPPLPIATQAVQSVSILVQNVSRATSLYFLLSNNYINELISLPLDLYSAAERHRRGDNSSGMSSRKYTSPELAELTTHFVSFLKSLALRMNRETLQFFFTYPVEQDGLNTSTASSAYFSQGKASILKKGKTRFAREDCPLDEVETNRIRARESTESFQARPVSVPESRVQFPLYARALEFCSPNQDSFVRLTAMNICLNTLRLAAVCEDQTGRIQETNGPSHLSPDGVLHNAEPLPLRERLAIAQHVCAPNRVGSLVSPIFAKLAQLWGVIEELIRQIDFEEIKQHTIEAELGDNDNSSYKRTQKTEKAKDEVRRKRLTNSFKDAAADLQDELMLLDDVFKVGLSSLNEQVVEMMLATFVYPLLLQPMLSFMQRFPPEHSPSVISSNSTVNPFSVNSLSSSLESSGMLRMGSSELVVEADTIPAFDAAPVKTAFFTLASVFHLLSNQPLLRLLFTALYHPLAPQASGESMIRAKPDVAISGPDGRVVLRLDSAFDSRTIGSSRATYHFGRVTGTKYSGTSGSQADGWQGDELDKSCVFILSPALARVLESNGNELSIISQTRKNPYRRSIFACLSDRTSLSGLRTLAVMSMDAAISQFDGQFVTDLLFGSGLKMFENEIPMDERRTDTKIVRERHDRDMGGAGSSFSSRRAAETVGNRFPKTGADSSYSTEILSSLCLAVLHTSSCALGKWSLEFDSIAAHVLLCAVRDNPQAIQTTAKMMERRKNQTASFLSNIPSRLDQIRNANGLDASSVNDRLGMLMNQLVFEKIGTGTNESSDVGQLLRLKDSSRVGDTCFLPVSAEGSFDELTAHVCNLGDQTRNRNVEVASNDFVWLISKWFLAYFQLDAFSSLVQSLSRAGARSLKREKLRGFAICDTGVTIDASSLCGKSFARSIFSPLSHGLHAVLVEKVKENQESEKPKPGSVVRLVGRTAFPCVCEVQQNSPGVSGESCVESEGVKWQSLYLVFFGGYMVLAEPIKGGAGGDGRIVSSCNLSRLKVGRDQAVPAQNKSTARRLLLSHDSFGMEAPGLFLLEDEPTYESIGPFVRLQRLRCCIDLWFEDQTSVERAANVLEKKIARAKAQRGTRLRNFLFSLSQD